MEQINRTRVIAAVSPQDVAAALISQMTPAPHTARMPEPTAPGGAVAPTEPANDTIRQPEIPKTATIPGGIRIAPPLPVEPAGQTKPLNFPKASATLRSEEAEELGLAKTERASTLRTTGDVGSTTLKVQAVPSPEIREAKRPESKAPPPLPPSAKPPSSAKIAAASAPASAGNVPASNNKVQEDAAALRPIVPTTKPSPAMKMPASAAKSADAPPPPTVAQGNRVVLLLGAAVLAMILFAVVARLKVRGVDHDLDTAPDSAFSQVDEERLLKSVVLPSPSSAPPASSESETEHPTIVAPPSLSDAVVPDAAPGETLTLPPTTIGKPTPSTAPTPPAPTPKPTPAPAPTFDTTGLSSAQATKQAQKALDGGDTKRALELARIATVADASNAEAWLTLGAVYQALGRNG
ncbi:MAG TPA: hypothetical protein VGM56_22685, partial [Byssovorax sp.]